MIVAEVGLSGACGDNEVVVLIAADNGTEFGGHDLLFDINVSHFAFDYVNVFLVFENLSCGWRNFTSGEQSSCYLVEKWLEKVVVGAVDDSDINIGVVEFLRGEQATKS